MAYPAGVIANRFLDLAKRDGKTLTNMQLQKLVYIAHGFYLAFTGKPLLYDEVKAWQWGPVIVDLYEALRQYGSGVVTAKIPAPAVELNPNAEQVIEKVWKAYGRLTAFQLSSITHKPNSPWSQTWETWGQYSTISNDVIAQYYWKLVNERKPATQATAQ
ncbi:MAG: type II toxin-antitoxin system antitoxin SocA domain-containing protein [Acidobacteriota bacterium]